MRFAREKKSGPIGILTHSGNIRMTEAQIQKTCSDFLVTDGWRVLVTNPCSDKARGKGFGELGMADCLYLRYGSGCAIFPSGRAMAEVIWIEWKKIDAKGNPTKASNHQIDWHFLERKCGALTLIAGEDFPATIEGFQKYYRASGLARSV